jgi:small GTP-binding protein
MISKKMLLIGKRGSGKTSLVRRLVFRAFGSDYQSTLGVDIYSSVVPAGRLSAGPEDLRLMIWDTQGEIEQRIFGHPYFQGTSAVCIVGDATNRDALEAMRDLALKCDAEATALPCILLCNKSDLLEAGQTPEWPAAFDPKRWPLFMTSAKDDINVTEAFEHTAKAIVRRGL